MIILLLILLINSAIFLSNYKFNMNFINYDNNSILANITYYHQGPEYRSEKGSEKLSDYSSFNSIVCPQNVEIILKDVDKNKVLCRTVMNDCNAQCVFPIDKTSTRLNIEYIIKKGTNFENEIVGNVQLTYFKDAKGELIIFENVNPVLGISVADAIKKKLQSASLDSIALGILVIALIGTSLYARGVGLASGIIDLLYPRLPRPRLSLNHAPGTINYGPGQSNIKEAGNVVQTVIESLKQYRAKIDLNRDKGHIKKILNEHEIKHLRSMLETISRYNDKYRDFDSLKIDDYIKSIDQTINYLNRIKNLVDKADLYRKLATPQPFDPSVNVGQSVLTQAIESNRYGPLAKPIAALTKAIFIPSIFYPFRTLRGLTTVFYSAFSPLVGKSAVALNKDFRKKVNTDPAGLMEEAEEKLKQIGGFERRISNGFEELLSIKKEDKILVKIGKSLINIVTVPLFALSFPIAGGLIFGSLNIYREAQANAIMFAVGQVGKEIMHVSQKELKDSIKTIDENMKMTAASLIFLKILTEKSNLLESSKLIADRLKYANNESLQDLIKEFSMEFNNNPFILRTIQLMYRILNNNNLSDVEKIQELKKLLSIFDIKTGIEYLDELEDFYKYISTVPDDSVQKPIAYLTFLEHVKTKIGIDPNSPWFEIRGHNEVNPLLNKFAQQFGFEHEQLGLAFLPFIIAMRSKNETELYERREKLPYYSFAILLSKYTTWTAPVYVARMVKGKFEGVFELQPEIRNEILESFVKEFTERLIAENNMDNKQIYQIRAQMNDLIKNVGSIQTIDDFKQEFYEYTSAIRQITGDQNIKFAGIELSEAENKDLIRRIWDFHSDKGEKLLKNLGVDQDPALIHYFRTNLITEDNKGQNNDEINNAIISGLKDYIDLTKSLELCLSEIRDRDTYIEYMINHEKDYKIEFKHNISANSLKQPIGFIFADRQDLFVSTTKLADAKGFDENASIVKRREVPILSLVDFLNMDASERSVQSQIYLRQNKGAYPLTESEERALSRESIFNEELEKAILSVDPRTQKAKYNEEYLAHYIGAFLVATNWVNKVIQYEYSLDSKPTISIYDLSAKQVEQIISGDKPIQLDIKNEDSKSNDNKDDKTIRIQINPLRGMSVNVSGLYDYVNVVIRDDEIIFRPFLERAQGLIKKDMFGRISRELTEKYFEKSIERIPLSSVDRPISLVAMRYDPIKGYYDVTYQNSNIEKELSILLSRLGDNLVPLLKRYTDRSEEDIAYALYKSLSYNINPLLNYSLSRLKIKIPKFYKDLENPEILSQMLDKLDTSFEATIVKIYIAQRLIIQQNSDPRIKSIIDRLQKIDHIKILEMINKNTNDIRILGILGIIGEINIQDIDVRKAVNRGLLVGNSPSNVASQYMSLKRELKPSDGEVGFGIFDRFKDFAVTVWNTNIYFNTVYYAMQASPYLDFAEKFGHTTGMLQHYYPLISQLFSLQARNNAKIAFKAETYIEQIRESINASPNQLVKISQDSTNEIDQITNQIISYVLEEYNLITEIATILNVDRELVAIHLNSIIKSDPNLRPSQISNLLINKLGLNVSSSSIQNQVKKIIDINSKINQLTASINDKLLESLDDAEKLILRYANNYLKIDLNLLIQNLQDASVNLNDQETVIKLLSSYLPNNVDPKNVYLMIADIKALRGQLDSEITSLGERLVNRQYLDPLNNKLLRDIGGKLIYLNLLREDLNNINQNIADISTAFITRHKLYNLIQNLEKLNSSKTGEMYLSLRNVKDRQNIERQLAIANSEITRSIVNIVESEEKYIRGYFMNSWLMNVRSTKGVWGDFGSFRGSDIAPTFHAGSGLFYPYYPYTMLFAITPQSVNPDDKTRNKSYFEIIKKRSNPIIHPLYSLTIKDVYRPIDSSKLEYEIESGKLDSEFEAWINRRRYLSMPSFIRYLDVFYNSAIKPISISNFRDLNLQRASIEGYLLLHPISMLYRGFYKSFKTTSVLDTPLPIFDRYKYNVHSIYVSKGMPSPRYANIFPNPALAWLHLKEYLLPTPPNLMNVYYGSNVLNTIFYPLINLPLGSLFAFALSRNPERLARYQNLVNYKANLLFRRKIEGMNISDFEERLLAYRPSYFYHEWLSSSVGAYWDLPGYGHIDQASGRLTIIEMYRRLYYHNHTRFERYNLNYNIWTRRRELLSDLEYYRPESAYQLDISQTFNLWILLFPGINFIPGISTIVNRYPLSFSTINKVSHMSSYGYVIPTYNIAYIRTQYGNGTVPRRLLRASGSRGLPPKDPRAGYLDTLRRLEINLKNKSKN